MEMGGGESYLPKEFNKGRKFIFSNQCQFYCDYSYAETPLRATLQFEPNVKGIPVPAENVLGIEAPMWTEWTGAFLDCEKMLYPRASCRRRMRLGKEAEHGRIFIAGKRVSERAYAERACAYAVGRCDGNGRQGS